MSRQDGIDRLERAMDLWLRYRDGHEGNQVEFLTRHEDLRDLLEPLLVDDDAPGPEPDQPVPEPLADIDDSAGTVLGDFRLLREVGRGGMGVVYEAWQASMDRRVAVKVLPDHLTRRPKAIARFKQEATTAGKLDHPGIVKVFAVGSEGDVHYFAMEFVDGAPLDKVLRETGRSGTTSVDSATFQAAVSSARRRVHADKESMPQDGPPPKPDSSVWDRSYIQTVVSLAASMADALHHAHKQGVIHRDVKPANILVREDGTAVLTDFGLAREEGLPSLTMTGEFAGTPYYVSPEQAMAKRVGLDHRTDIFSLGVTLYELLTHRRPFEGDTSHAVLHKILHREPPDPIKLNPLLAPDLIAVLMKAMEKEPRLRYETAAELADDLRNFLAYRPVSARRLTRARRLRRWVSREPLKAGLFAVLLVSVPVMSWLGGYVLASQDSIAAGDEALHKKRVEDLVREGFLQCSRGGFAEARKEFELAHRLDPESADALMGLVYSLTRLGQGAPAMEILDANEQRTEGSMCMMRLRWHVLDGLGRDDEAAALLGRIPDPKTPLDHMLLGFESLSAGQEEPFNPEHPRKALAHFARASELSSTAQPVHHYLQILAASRDKGHEALPGLVRKIESFWPDAPHSWEWLALALQDLDPARSEAYYYKAIKRRPLDEFLHVSLGRLLATRGKLEEAAQSIQHAIDLKPEEGHLRLMLAQLKIQLKDFDGAAEQCRICLQHNRKARDYHTVGLLFSRMGRTTEAVDAYREAVLRRPNYGAIRRDLARALVSNGQKPEAAKEYVKACELDPRFAPGHRTLALLQAELERPADSAAAWEKYCALTPGKAEGHFQLATQYYRLRRFRKASEAAERAVRVDRNHAAAIHIWALSLVGEGRFDEARLQLVQALNLDSDRYAPEYRRLARSWIQQEPHRDGAILIFRLFVEREPKSQTAHEDLVAAWTLTRQHGKLRGELLRWVDHNQKSPAAWEALARHLLSPDLPAHWRSEDLALNAARKAVELSKRKDPRCLAVLADALYADGQPEAAVKAANEALSKIASGTHKQLEARLKARLAVFRKGGNP